MNFFRKKFKLVIILILFFSPSYNFLSAENIKEKSLKNNIDSSSTKYNLPEYSYLKDKEYEDYILSSGDYLEISISDYIPELKNKYLIDGSGTIYLPYIDRVYIKGLTVDELARILDKKYEEFIKIPETKIRILAYRPIRFITEGEIENPGLHTLAGSYFNSETREDFETSPISNLSDDNKSSYLGFSPGIGYDSAYFPTLFDAIKKSGGITPYSDLSSIEVIRIDSISNGRGLKKTTINLLDVLFNNQMEQNIRILDGDRIILKKNNKKLDAQMSAAFRSNLNPKYMSVFVTGSVRQPGKKIITKTTTLNDAIAIAGGRQPLSGKIVLIRYRDDGETIRSSYPYLGKAKKGSKKNPFLKKGDIIIVNQNKVNIASQVIKKATDPFLGIYSLFKIFD